MSRCVVLARAGTPASTVSESTPTNERPPVACAAGGLVEMIELHTGAEHILRTDPLIELFFREQAELQGLFLECGSVLMSRLGDLGRIIITDVGIESRHQHQGVLIVVGQAVNIRRDARSTVFIEHRAGIG